MIHGLRLAVFDREPLFRQGIILAVARLGVRIVCAESDRHDLPEAIEREQPDVVIVDKIEDFPFIELIRSGRMERPLPVIVIIHQYISPIDIALLRRIATVGLLHRKATAKELRAAIRNLSAGRSFECALVTKYASEISWLVDPALDALDLSIFQSLAHGATKQEIAKSMRIKVDAVNHRVRKLYRLLGVHNRDDLLRTVLTAMDSWLKVGPEPGTDGFKVDNSDGRHHATHPPPASR